MVRDLTRLHAGSLAFIFVVESLFVFLIGSAGHLAGLRLVRLADTGFTNGAASWGRILPAVGAASVVHLFWHHRFRNHLLVCAVLAVIVLWLL
jgi:mannose/fructose/N-acetylgalactosamine-specific phosphotransferase system component IIC